MIRGKRPQPQDDTSESDNSLEAQGGDHTTETVLNQWKEQRSCRLFKVVFIFFHYCLFIALINFRGPGGLNIWVGGSWEVCSLHTQKCKFSIAAVGVQRSCAPGRECTK